MRTVRSSPTTSFAWLREIPTSRRTIWHSGARPMTTSPDSNVKVRGLSPS
ncbi:MAG: hypothetical protein U0599_15945 [Vicinamibacteria bacterium]